MGTSQRVANDQMVGQPWAPGSHDQFIKIGLLNNSIESFSCGSQQIQDHFGTQREAIRQTSRTDLSTTTMGDSEPVAKTNVLQMVTAVLTMSSRARHWCMNCGVVRRIGMIRSMKSIISRRLQRAKVKQHAWVASVHLKPQPVFHGENRTEFKATNKQLTGKTDEPTCRKLMPAIDWKASLSTFMVDGCSQRLLGVGRVELGF